MAGTVLKNITQRLGGRTVLDGVTLEARAGEFLVILGPTGAGKTTLLRTLAGLDLPTGGTIFQGERDITRLPPAQRDMAMVFQNFSLYPRLSVFDNLAFGLRPAWRGIARAEIERRVRWAAELLGLTEKLGARPTELSGGQQQRVAIGRVIVREPRLFLFDEPLASLDAKLRESMSLEIHRLQRRLGVTMFYVTHDQTEAMALADRIVVLDGGRVLQIGTPGEIYSWPRTPRVAQLLGSPPVNLLTRGAMTHLFPAFNLPAGAGAFGIRAENIRLIPVETGTATVSVVEHLGPITLIHLTTRVDADSISLRVTLPPNAAVRVGQRFLLSAKEDDILSWSA